MSNTTIVKQHEKYSMNGVNFEITRGLMAPNPVTGDTSFMYQIQTFNEDFTEVIDTYLGRGEEKLCEMLSEYVGGNFKFVEN